MANEYMEGCSASLAIREMPTKTTNEPLSTYQDGSNPRQEKVLEKNMEKALDTIDKRTKAVQMIQKTL